MKIIILTLFFILNLYSQEDLLKKSIKLLNEGKYKEAIELLKQIYKETPSSIELNLSLAIAYVQTDEYEKAKFHLGECLKVKKDLISARYILAMIYEKEKKYEKAIEEWRLIFKISQDKELKEMAEKHIKQIEMIKK